jgi:hypothetical protein
VTQARSEHGRYLFKVSEYGDGSCWISTEPRDRDIPALKHALLGFQLRPGTTIKQAEEIAKFMNEHTTEVSLTLFDKHPLFHRA